MKEIEVTKETITDIKKRVKANYKFTEVRNEFLHKVLGQYYNFKYVYVEHLRKVVVNPTTNYRLRFGGRAKNEPVYILNNDFEVLDENGKVNRTMTEDWREGMRNVLTGRDLEEYNLEVKNYDNKASNNFGLDL